MDRDPSARRNGLRRAAAKARPGAWRMLRLVAAVVALTVLIGLALPARTIIPVQGASPRDWHAKTFWYEPWGASGVHKGIDVFADSGTPVLSPSYGVVLFAGALGRGGKAVVVIGPKWRLHYLAHLRTIDARSGQLVRRGAAVGQVGDSGNAVGKAPHLHYSVLTLVPYPWRISGATQGWKRAFYLDPNDLFDAQ